jgi:4-hydroxy-tetrahydrodipicolinate synthase
MPDWNENLLGGLIPAVPVPFDPHGKPDLDANGKFASWMATQPVDGVAVWTDIARGHLLDAPLRRAILKAWREAMGPERWIVAAVGQNASAEKSQALESAIGMAGDAAGLADLLLVRVSQETDPAIPGGGIVEYHREIAALGIPLLISFPAACPDPCGCETADALLSMPEVAGAVVSKADSTDDLQDFITYARMSHPTKAILTGEDRLFGYSLYRGCHGALLGLASICPAIQRAMVDAWFMGEPAQFLNLSRLVDYLAEAVYSKPKDSHVRKLLVGLAHMGVIPPDAVNDPLGPEVSNVDEELVRATIEALGEWGYS